MKMALTVLLPALAVIADVERHCLAVPFERSVPCCEKGLVFVLMTCFVDASALLEIAGPACDPNEHTLASPCAFGHQTGQAKIHW